MLCFQEKNLFAIFANYLTMCVTSILIRRACLATTYQCFALSGVNTGGPRTAGSPDLYERSTCCAVLADPMTAAFCKFARFTWTPSFFNFAIDSTVMFDTAPNVPITIGSMMTGFPLVRLICSASGKYLSSFSFDFARFQFWFSVPMVTSRWGLVYTPLWWVWVFGSLLQPCFAFACGLQLFLL